MTPQRPQKPGGEVDAWCTKCRMDLLHRIIAMNGGKIVRVECRTCGGHHNYHRPKSLGTATRGSSSAPPRGLVPSKAAPSKSAGPRRTNADEAERQRTAAWEKAVLGQPITSFKPYRPSATFKAGELVRHAKFGDGTIVRVIDSKKVEVMFKDGPRTLAQALDL
jgi:hypothetical protein